MILNLIDSPGNEVVTLDEAKNHLRVDIDDDDELIVSLIVAARRLCESHLKMAIVQSEFRLRLNGFPAYSDEPIQIPNPPLVSVESITYQTSTETATWDSSHYEVITGSPGLVQPSVGRCYPYALCREGSITIDFTAGYNQFACPAAIKQSILLLCGLYYDHRAAADPAKLMEIPFGVKALLGSENWGVML